jgi:hypothetical protein
VPCPWPLTVPTGKNWIGRKREPTSSSPSATQPAAARRKTRTPPQVVRQTISVHVTHISDRTEFPPEPVATVGMHAWAWMGQTETREAGSGSISPLALSRSLSIVGRADVHWLQQQPRRVVLVGCGWCQVLISQASEPDSTFWRVCLMPRAFVVRSELWQQIPVTSSHCWLHSHLTRSGGRNRIPTPNFPYIQMRYPPPILISPLAACHVASPRLPILPEIPALWPVPHEVRQRTTVAADQVICLKGTKAATT